MTMKKGLIKRRLAQIKQGDWGNLAHSSLTEEEQGNLLGNATSYDQYLAEKYHSRNNY